MSVTYDEATDQWTASHPVYPITVSGPTVH
jgi:hypothetical protein